MTVFQTVISLVVTLAQQVGVNNHLVSNNQQTACKPNCILSTLDALSCTCASLHQVGVDINLVASNQWMASTLPFVAGLGSRKARALLQVRCASMALSTGICQPRTQYKSKHNASLVDTGLARCMYDRALDISLQWRQLWHTCSAAPRCGVITSSPAG